MRHILWAIAWMGLGLLITMAAASVLQGVATGPREPVAGAPMAPAPTVQQPRIGPTEPAVSQPRPGRSLIVVARGSALDQ